MIIAYMFNICVIMGLTFYLRYLVSDKAYSLVWSIIFYAVSGGKNRKGMQWYYHNPLYICYTLLMLCLVVLNLTLIGQLIHSDILTRPLISIVSSCSAWLFVLLVQYFSNQIIKAK